MPPDNLRLHSANGHVTDLCVRGVSKIFRSPRGAVHALGEVSFSAVRTEFISIVGPSGCGKSTLLRLLAGLAEPDLGRIEFCGWPRQPRARLVFQDHALFPWMSVADNVAFGLEMEGTAAGERRARAQDQLRLMGMGDFAAHFPGELSGGMRQRVAIARAFVTEPDILLMDEPLRALDAQMRLVIQEELLRLWQARRPLVLYVTHDIDEALLLSDRVMVMSGQPGTIREIVSVPLSRPRDLTGRAHPELVDLKWHIWSMLESEVRARLTRHQ
ncbi:MAG: ABC transporter ATP-binding protein [Chloroflexi bacterium]|nr:ABC transporter ATP-binding protein [Chloroflexota bacterium]